ncbi:MAG: MotA/TolQ/ExbB proton channel family protein [Akkermansia sp.]
MECSRLKRISADCWWWPVSPLVGVLGTIQGLIGFYSQPGVLEGKAPTLAMSDAVFQALLSSALGLSIAIPAYLFYCYLASRARQVVHSLERAGTEAVCLVCDARQEREDGERMAGRRD